MTVITIMDKEVRQVSNKITQCRVSISNLEWEEEHLMVIAIKLFNHLIHQHQVSIEIIFTTLMEMFHHSQ